MEKEIRSLPLLHKKKMKRKILIKTKTGEKLSHLSSSASSYLSQILVTKQEKCLTDKNSFSLSQLSRFSFTSAPF